MTAPIHAPVPLMLRLTFLSTGKPWLIDVSLVFRVETGEDPLSEPGSVVSYRVRR